MIQTLTAAEALPYFAHPSQARWNELKDDLADWMQYRALNGVCIAFHPSLWPDVWMVHIGAMPQAWGRLDGDVKAILQDFAKEENAARLTAWVKESNRAVLALCRRIGWEIDGRLPLAEPVAMLGWRPQCQ